MISVAFSNVSDTDSKLQTKILQAILKHLKLSRRDIDEIIEIYLQKYNKTKCSKVKNGLVQQST